MRWIVATGVLVGFGFLAKELQAFLVLPAFGLVYLLAGPPRLARADRRCRGARSHDARGRRLVGWRSCQLWPASSRPYIGGSQNNSFWNVLFGYNGFGRLTGNESGSVGGAPTGSGQWGPTGFTRMFNAEFGGQISWLLPAALLLLVAGLAFTADPRAHRSDTRRARPLGRVVGRDRPRVLARSGHHPRVLLRRSRARDRCDRRHRRDDVLGAPRQSVRPRVARVRDRGDGDLWVTCFSTAPRRGSRCCAASC